MHASVQPIWCLFVLQIISNFITMPTIQDKPAAAVQSSRIGGEENNRYFMQNKLGPRITAQTYGASWI